MKGRLGQVLIHIAGCVTFLALPIVFSPDAGNLSDLWKYPPALKDFLVYLALLLFFYFNYFWLIPNYYFKRRYTGFFLIILLCFAVIVVVPNMLIEGHPPREGYEFPANNPLLLPSDRPPRDLQHPPPLQHPADTDTLSSYGRGSSPAAGHPLPPPDGNHGQGHQQPSPRSLLPDVSHQVFLFLAVFFLSFILKMIPRWRQTGKE
ncbi:hypothetical protein [Chitinophaga sp. S165]|uniref:hypothetical protein n=1 Tax=Chitinophaga sp. S165 TaxID=2135462 RepID=UPI000D70A3C3|nr:hypothetical protein [Chitinophaga sp. S165]PWV53449.1 hypothetical protein C7475_102197 [Chitinophaga sp. S165]